MLLYESAVILLMLAINAVFAAYEMALAAIPKARIEALLYKKKLGAKEALFMKERIEASLAVIQLGITVVGAVAAAVGGAGADDIFVPYFQSAFGLSDGTAEFLALSIIIVPLSAVTIIFGELVPKTFALGNKEKVCLALSPFMKLLSLLFHPAVWILEKTVKVISFRGIEKIKNTSETDDLHIHELKAAASIARTSRLISAREEKILHSVSELSRRAVSSILIPVDQISTIAVGMSLNEALIKAHLDMHTRFPVCGKEDDPQSIVGYVNFKDIVFALRAKPADPTIRGIVRPIKTLSAEANISSALEMLIQSNAHIAIARNASNRVVGLLTLEDLMEELVGDIHDEYDKLPTFIHAQMNGWIIGSGAPMDLVASTVGISMPSAQKDGREMTLSEWCELRKPGPIKPGDVIEHENLAVSVRKLRRNRLWEAFVVKK